MKNEGTKFGQQAASVALLWGQPKSGRRGPKPSLSIDRLVDEAIALADSHGLAELSMERLARELGFTTMALYRYVPGKAELIDLVVDRGLGPPPVFLGGGGTWRDGLVRWASALLEVFRRHPWSLEATGRLRVMGPNELLWLEAGLEVLAPTGLTPSERYEACLALLGEVRTSAQFSASRKQGLTGAQWASATRALIDRDRARFPQLHAVLSLREEHGSIEQQLGWALDGIAARIDRRKRAGRASKR